MKSIKVHNRQKFGKFGIFQISLLSTGDTYVKFSGLKKIFVIFKNCSQIIFKLSPSVTI